MKKYFEAIIIIFGVLMLSNLTGLAFGYGFSKMTIDQAVILSFKTTEKLSDES